MGTLAIENSGHSPTFCKNRWFCWIPDVGELKLSSRPKTSIKSRLVDITGKISFILGKMTSEGLSNDLKFCINIDFFFDPLTYNYYLNFKSCLASISTGLDVSGNSVGRPNLFINPMSYETSYNAVGINFWLHITWTMKIPVFIPSSWIQKSQIVF